MNARAEPPLPRRAASDPLVLALREPRSMLSLDKAAWMALLARARDYLLLPRLADLAREAGIFEALPRAATARMAAACLHAERNATDVRFEVHCILRALGAYDGPIVLLKGAAYIGLGLALSRRRYCSDLDLMVPRERLAEVEGLLLAAGWKRGVLSDYDQQYYLRWMHELPPMAHPDRAFTVDMHHTIHPPTARRTPNPQALFEAARPIGDSRLEALCPADMVLHAGLHLFNEEILIGLSDLADLHDLLTAFGEDAGFWDDLQARARLHGLQRVLYYLLRYSHLLLATSVPEPVLRAAAAPALPLRLLMDGLFLRALVPPDGRRWQPARAAAVWLLYVRSHWLRMPLRLLLPHLGRKAIHRHTRRTSSLHPTSAVE